VDCNDADPAVHPGAPEVCGNQVDDDCDAQVDEGCAGLYSPHTIVIDGQNDFDPPTEAFVTSSPGYTSYVAWDANYLYAALQGPDVASQNASKWLLLYLGTGSSSGTTVGLSYGGQQPTLSFRAQHHVRWNAGSMLSQALTFEESWTPNGWDLAGQVAQSGDFVEMRISRAALGSPSRVWLHEHGDETRGGAELCRDAFGLVPDEFDPTSPSLRLLTRKRGASQRACP
jgi:hypothetical protein